MFFDAAHLALVADQHHRELVADAAHYRLAKLARAMRQPAEPRRPGPVSTGEQPAARNEDADRRYVMSR